jgi:hypothetical protein
MFELALYLVLMLVGVLYPFFALRRRLRNLWTWLGNEQDGTLQGLSTDEYDDVWRDIIAPVIAWVVGLMLGLATFHLPGARCLYALGTTAVLGAWVITTRRSDYSWLLKRARPSRQSKEMARLVQLHDFVITIRFDRKGST